MSSPQDPSPASSGVLPSLARSSSSSESVGAAEASASDEPTATFVSMANKVPAASPRWLLLPRSVPVTMLVALQAEADLTMLLGDVKSQAVQSLHALISSTDSAMASSLAAAVSSPSAAADSDSDPPPPADGAAGDRPRSRRSGHSRTKFHSLSHSGASAVSQALAAAGGSNGGDSFVLFSAADPSNTAFGAVRGRCAFADCICATYARPPYGDNLQCACCGHYPAAHVVQASAPAPAPLDLQCSLLNVALASDTAPPSFLLKRHDALPLTAQPVDQTSYGAMVRRVATLERLVRLLQNPEQNRLFGVPVEQVLRVEAERAAVSETVVKGDRQIPYILREIISALREHVKVQGLLRISASLEAVNRIKQEINRSTSLPVLSQYTKDPHVLADLFKSFLKELGEPLLTARYAPRFLNAQISIGDDAQRFHYYASLLDSLPRPNYRVLRAVVDFLRELAENSEQNKLNMQSLAKLMAPILLGDLTDTRNVSNEEAQIITIDTAVTSGRVVEYIAGNIDQLEEVKTSKPRAMIATVDAVRSSRGDGYLLYKKGDMFFSFGKTRVDSETFLVGELQRRIGLVPATDMEPSTSDEVSYEGMTSLARLRSSCFSLEELPSNRSDTDLADPLVSPRKKTLMKQPSGRTQRSEERLAQDAGSRSGIRRMETMPIMSADAGGSSGTSHQGLSATATAGAGSNTNLSASMAGLATTARRPEQFSVAGGASSGNVQPSRAIEPLDSPVNEKRKNRPKSLAIDGESLKRSLKEESVASNGSNRSASGANRSIVRKKKATGSDDESEAAPPTSPTSPSAAVVAPVAMPEASAVPAAVDEVPKSARRSKKEKKDK